MRRPVDRRSEDAHSSRTVLLAENCYPLSLPLPPRVKFFALLVILVSQLRMREAVASHPVVWSHLTLTLFPRSFRSNCRLFCQGACACECATSPLFLTVQPHRIQTPLPGDQRSIIRLPNQVSWPFKIPIPHSAPVNRQQQRVGGVVAFHAGLIE